MTINLSIKLDKTIVKLNRIIINIIIIINYYFY